ncbi:beta-ketoacyl synthase N-terminal-like domain-containing protein [Roseivivax isoporae]|uniref:3-oxoacyl-ACP synthase n=1 Tax=Roseivivax isoporae LMG 25204 TaxID=1449351 RepID=X7FBR0_9RHOB|nr:beta-ketoacyl synthase N-terminal-like domain-containing protein [Roseivivax isoporae]ETX30245.1 3-oxoacyl-ACP synthase [Roseivivax isoporae LMG 25204]
MTGVNVIAAGMVTAVGLTGAASCAAMRCGIDGFAETQFVVPGGAWLVGAPVPLPRDWVGSKRLAHLAAGAVVDALERAPQVRDGTLPVILCLAEETRPGRPVRTPETFGRQVLEFSDLPLRSPLHVVAHGRPSGIVALERVRRMFERGEAERALIVGVDSLLTGSAVAHYLRAGRLLTGDNANGFVPGEAAAAIVCAAGAPQHFALAGLGLGREPAYLYNPDEVPLRADGMVRAYRDAFDAAGIAGRDVDVRVSDLTGEAFFFKQTALAMQRTVRQRTDNQALWTPTDCIGNVGAAIVPVMVGWALDAFERGYGAGDPILVESSGDDGACGAAVFRTARARAVA